MPEPEPRPATEAATYPDWESVYQDNVVGIYQLVYRKVGNAADAEDLAEEVLMQTLKTLRLPAPVPTIRAYLVKTARTVLADHWRRHYAARDAANELEQMHIEISANPDAAHRAARLPSLLPDHFGAILELRLLRRYSGGAAGTQLGSTEAN